MPYIAKENREWLDLQLPPGLTIESVGNLNYMLTQVVEQYRAERGDSYQTFAEIEAALQHASKEFYRRVVVPYEDHKMVQNGDVYA